MDYILSSKKTTKLKKVEIDSICKLKSTHWNYSFKSNLEWFKKHIKSYDVHNLIYFNSKLIGYTLLRIRTCFFGKVKKKYFYFDTLIIDKKYRNQEVSYFLMKFNNQVIKKNNKISFLICLDKMVKYYKKFGWKLIPKKLLSIKDHYFHTNGMYFNIKSLNKKNYVFFLFK